MWNIIYLYFSELYLNNWYLYIRKELKMLERYKIRVIKTWDFELDGKSKENIEEQLK